jgi:hypothetical protein
MFHKSHDPDSTLVLTRKAEGKQVDAIPDTLVDIYTKKDIREFGKIMGVSEAKFLGVDVVVSSVVNVIDDLEKEEKFFEWFEP